MSERKDIIKGCWGHVKKTELVEETHISQNEDNYEIKTNDRNGLKRSIRQKTMTPYDVSK